MNPLLSKLLGDCNLDGEFLNQKFADYLDERDGIRSYKNAFHLPGEAVEESSKVTYLCGNSLGLQPKKVSEEVNFHLTKWAQLGVKGHFTEPQKWLTIDDIVQKSLASIVGALPHEVVAMNSLTCNLHLMMISFYKPSPKRHKVLMEKKAFPSDFQAVQSQIIMNGLNPAESLLEISSREGEEVLRMEDIEEIIRREGQSIALILFSGVQYYTGQLFDIQRITSLGHSMGCLVGFDLAHTVGNVPLHLHEWDCDFACWCSYKYLNSGPGAIAGCFIHDRHCGQPQTTTPAIDCSSPDLISPDVSESTMKLSSPIMPQRLVGWWGHRLEDRFDMASTFIPCHGAYGFRLSNPPVLMIACLRASLDLFDEVGMDRLRKKSKLLTGYLEALIDDCLSDSVRIITPRDPEQRGCQLSLQFIRSDVERIQNELQSQYNIICDIRKPDVMRVAPVPLYNSFNDVFKFVCVLKTLV